MTWSRQKQLGMFFGLLFQPKNHGGRKDEVHGVRRNSGIRTNLSQFGCPCPWNQAERLTSEWERRDHLPFLSWYGPITCWHHSSVCPALFLESCSFELDQVYGMYLTQYLYLHLNVVFL